MEKTTQLNALKNQTLFKGLTEAQLRQLIQHSEEAKYLPNDTIVTEGDLGQEIYLLVDGEVNVLKWDQENLSQVVIGKIGKGNMFGEMSFMDGSPRSTTIKAMRPTTVFKLDKEKIPAKLFDEINQHIYANIATSNISRLRNENELYAKSVKDYQYLIHVRQKIGRLLYLEYLILGLSMFLSVLFFKNNAAYLSWILALIPTFFLVRRSNLEWTRFGLNFQNSIPVILTSFVIAAGILSNVYFFNYFFSPGEYLIYTKTPQIAVSLQPLLSWPLLLIYCFAQELIARGILQNSIKDFFQDENNYLSILLNSFFIFCLALVLGYQNATSLFLINIPMGLIFSHQKNIFGVTILHFILLIFGVITVHSLYG